MKWWFGLLLLLLFSCAVENPESAIDLAPPLGLSVTNNSSAVEIRFYGFNNESYFTGYSIFISTNYSDLLGETVSSASGLLLNSLTNINDSTINSYALYVSTPFLYTQQSNYMVYVNGVISNDTLASSTTYFYAVRAFSRQYSLYSKRPSNIATNTY